jgi:choline dehydrogenase-like flavoprotein
MDSFDYIVVGAGSAGCVLANRLTEDGRHTVLVVEYGGSDNSLFIRMPSALSIPMNKARYNWFYRKRCGDRTALVTLRRAEHVGRVLKLPVPRQERVQFVALGPGGDDAL